MKKKPGPKKTFDVLMCFRIPQWMADYLDSKGNRSEVARRIIEDARRRDEERKRTQEEINASVERGKKIINQMREDGSL